MEHWLLEGVNMWTSIHIQAQSRKFCCFQKLDLKDYLRKSKQSLSLKS